MSRPKLLLEKYYNLLIRPNQKVKFYKVLSKIKIAKTKRKKQNYFLKRQNI